MIAIFGHVRIDLVFADNNEIHSVLLHRPKYIGAAGQHVADYFVCSPKSIVVHLFRSDDGQSIDIHKLTVKRTRFLFVLIPHQFEKSCRWC